MGHDSDQHTSRESLEEVVPPAFHPRLRRPSIPPRRYRALFNGDGDDNVARGESGGGRKEGGGEWAGSGGDDGGGEERNAKVTSRRRAGICGTVTERVTSRFGISRRARRRGSPPLVGDARATTATCR